MRFSIEGGQLNTCASCSREAPGTSLNLFLHLQGRPGTNIFQVGLLGGANITMEGFRPPPANLPPTSPSPSPPPPLPPAPAFTLPPPPRFPQTHRKCPE